MTVICIFDYYRTGHTMNVCFRPNIHVLPKVTAQRILYAIDRIFKGLVQSVLIDHCLNFEAERRESELNKCVRVPKSGRCRRALTQCDRSTYAGIFLLLKILCSSRLSHSLRPNVASCCIIFLTPNSVETFHRNATVVKQIQNTSWQSVIILVISH